MFPTLCFVATQHWWDPPGARALLRDGNPSQYEERLQGHEGAVAGFSLKSDLTSALSVFISAKHDFPYVAFASNLDFVLPARWTRCSALSNTHSVCLCLRLPQLGTPDVFLEWFLLNKLVVLPALRWSAVSILWLCHARRGGKCQGADGAPGALWSAQLFYINTEWEQLHNGWAKCLAALSREASSGLKGSSRVLLLGPGLICSAVWRAMFLQNGRTWPCTSMWARNSTHTPFNNFWRISSRIPRAWRNLGSGGWRSTPKPCRCVCNIFTTLCLQVSAPFQSVDHFFLSFLFFCRLQVEFYLLKPSASSLHLLQRAQILPGSERLPEMLPSAVWEPVSLINPSQRLDSLNSFLQTVSSAYRAAPPTRSKCWLTTF